MTLNFDAQVRLTEALLPLLRESAPSAIVNVSSVSGGVARAGSGAYAASKFALAGWSESLYLEERAQRRARGAGAARLHRHRGLPGRGAQGAPLHPLDGVHPRAAWPRRSWTPARGGRPSATCRARTRWPRSCRVLAPRSTARVMSGGGAAVMTTATRARDARRPTSLRARRRRTSAPLRSRCASPPSPAGPTAGRFVSFAWKRVARCRRGVTADVHLVAGLVVAHRGRQSARVLDLVAVHRGDHVAGAQAGVRRRCRRRPPRPPGRRRLVASVVCTPR